MRTRQSGCKKRTQRKMRSTSLAYNWHALIAEGSKIRKRKEARITTRKSPGKITSSSRAVEVIDLTEEETPWFFEKDRIEVGTWGGAMISLTRRA